MSETTKMTFEEVLQTIRDLATSQGMYGRMLSNLQELEENDPNKYEELKEQWTNRFDDPVDFVIYIES